MVRLPVAQQWHQDLSVMNVMLGGGLVRIWMVRVMVALGSGAGGGGRYHNESLRGILEMGSCGWARGCMIL